MQSGVPELPPAKYVDRADCVLAYFTLGARSGIPLVLCHGLAASGLQFVRDAEWFAARGYFVVVPDIRGHGRCTLKRPADEIAFDVRTLADDMSAILDAENLEAVHWLGNSLGGIIGLEMMGAVQERLLSFISFGTSYSLGVPQFAVFLSSMFARLAGKDILASILAPMTCREAEGQAVIAAMLKQTDIAAAVAIGKQVSRYDLIAKARAFENPILLLRGTLDQQVNSALHATLAAMHGKDSFSRIDVADAGHCANLDQPEIIRGHVIAFVAAGASPFDGVKSKIQPG